MVRGRTVWVVLALMAFIVSSGTAIVSTHLRGSQGPAGNWALGSQTVYTLHADGSVDLSLLWGGGRGTWVVDEVYEDGDVSYRCRVPMQGGALEFKHFSNADGTHHMEYIECYTQTAEVTRWTLATQLRHSASAWWSSFSKLLN